MLKVINGDIFDSTEKYIAHQCNCVSNKAAYLAYDIFNKYPYADIYSSRRIFKHDQAMIFGKTETPGEIVIRGNGKDQRYVIAILGQYYPGRPRYPNSGLDQYKSRQVYFYEALCEIANIEDLHSVALPYGIGCGAAGGDWKVYYKIIENFAKFLDGKADVFIYKKD